jgi:transposase
MRVAPPGETKALRFVSEGVGRLERIGAPPKGFDPRKEAATMHHCGADVHSKSTLMTILNSKGKEVFSERVPTERSALQAVVRPYIKKGIRVIQETGSSQAFIQKVFGEIGVEVVTVHAKHMKVITASKKKFDKRDSFHLADRSCKNDLPEPVYVPSESEQELRVLLAALQRAKKGRNQAANGVRGHLKSQGIVLPGGYLSRHSGWQHLLEMDLPKALGLVVRASYDVWAAQVEALGRIEHEIEVLTKDDDLAKRVQTIPYVGPACGAAVRAYLGDLGRFHGRKAVVSYAGFAPVQKDSGERKRSGHITKEGPPRLRSVFIQAAHLLIGSGFRRHPGWKSWYERLLHRRGHRNIAVVAVAKRLLLLAYHVGLSGEDYRPSLKTS